MPTLTACVAFHDLVLYDFRDAMLYLMGTLLACWLDVIFA